MDEIVFSMILMLWMMKITFCENLISLMLHEHNPSNGEICLTCENFLDI